MPLIDLPRFGTLTSSIEDREERSNPLRQFDLLRRLCT